MSFLLSVLLSGVTIQGNTHINTYIDHENGNVCYVASRVYMDVRGWGGSLGDRRPKNVRVPIISISCVPMKVKKK